MVAVKQTTDNYRSYFEFSKTTKQAVANRQKGVCASCGEKLIDAIQDGENVHAHHLIPAQCGDVNNGADTQFLRSEGNCVYLCHDCHFSVGHDENYRTGSVVEPNYFYSIYPFAFGKGKSQSGDFGQWASNAQREFDRIFDRIEKEHKAKQKE